MIEVQLTGNADLRFRRFFKSGLWGALGMHCALVLIFFYFRVEVLTYFNLLSVAIYLCCLALFRNTKYSSFVLSLTFIEIVAHGVLASYVLGWSSGFDYYLIDLAPLILINPDLSEGAKIINTLALAVIFTAVNLWTPAIADAFTQSAPLVAGFRCINAISCFVTLAILINIYTRDASSAELRLLQVANTDLLTNLSTRRRFIEHARRSGKEAGGRGRMVILMDIDHFKSINDHYGHASGDLVLIEVARVMSVQMRENDILARWGGEEFVALLENVDLETALTIAERIRLAVFKMNITTSEGKPIDVSLTAGVTPWRPKESLETAIARADKALYRGKNEGRNQVKFDPSTSGVDRGIYGYDRNSTHSLYH